MLPEPGLSPGGSCIRLPAPDVARGLAMVLVVFGHNTLLAQDYPMVVGWIFLFHVPAFFMISGYLIRPERRADIARLAQRLLLPGLLVGALLLGVKLVLRGGEPVMAVAGLRSATGPTLPSSQLWFLPVLFLVLVILPGLARSCAGWVGAGACLGLLGLAAWGGLHLPALPAAEALRQPGVSGPIGWPWGLDLLALALFFAFAGHLLARLYPGGNWPLWWLPSGLAITVAAFMSVTHNDLNMREMQPFLPGLVAALAGSLAVLSAGRFLASIPPLQKGLSMIGKRSLSILLFHILIQNAAANLLAGRIPGAGWMALVSAIVFSLLLSVCWERIPKIIGHRQI